MRAGHYASPVQAAVVEVIAVCRLDDVATIRVRVERGDLPSNPIAPAGLYARDDPNDERAQLHKLVTRGEVWHRQRFDEGDHDHCLLTWETIRSGDEAYRSDRGEWISSAAYERFVRDDVLRIRR